MTQSERAALDALIAEATVDCYNESECVTGFYTMLVDNLAVPFQLEFRSLISVARVNCGAFVT